MGTSVPYSVVKLMDISGTITSTCKMVPPVWVGVLVSGIKHIIKKN